MARRVSSRVFVGRGDELSHLDAALRRAQAGEAAAVLIGGEAGVGKTRLLGEVMAHARAAGVKVLMGDCAALGGASAPFLPVIEALRALPEELGFDVPSDLVGFLRPEVARPVDAGPMAPTRVFESLLAMLRRAGRSQPVLLAIDDVHWADRSTLDFLAFAIRNLHDEQLLLLAAYREEEFDRRPDLRAWLVEAYGGGAERVSLTPFGRKEHEQLLAGVIGAPAPPALAQELYARSAGNAFFAEELLAAARGDGFTGIPETLRDVLRARLEALPSGAQAVVRATAASGRPVDTRVLAAVAEIRDAELVATLREVLRHHVLIADGARVRFRHPLLRDVAYEELMPGEREAVHLRFAAALAREPDGREGAARAAEIAEHWWRAGDLPGALVSAVSAAIESEAVHAPAESQVHFERALELWERVPDPEGLVPLSRVELLSHAAEAAEVRGSPERAGALVEQALALVDADHQPLRAALLHERLGWYLDRQGRSAESLVTFEHAVRLLPEEPSAGRVRVLASAGYEFMRCDRWLESRRLSEEALASARAVGAPLEEALALVTLGHVVAELGDRDEGIGQMQRALVVLRELGQPAEAVRPAINLSDLLKGSGRFEEAARVAMEGVAAAREAGLELTYGTFAMSNAIRALIQLGAWDEAQRLADDAVARPLTGLPASALCMVRAELDIWRGRLEAAEHQLAAAREAPTGELPIDWRYELDALEAERAIWERRTGDAIAAAAATVSAPGTDASTRDRLRLAAVTVRALADHAELERTRIGADRLQRSRELAAQIEGDVRARLDDADDTAVGPEETATMMLIAAERTRLGDIPDPERWEAAVAALETWGPPHRVAYGKWRLSEALLAARAPRVEAAARLRSAHQTARRLGALVLNAEIEALARRARINLSTPSTDAVPTRSPLAELGLTAREVEVLEHLADGETDRQIAESLFISIKTAGVHVSNILRKLDASTRSEAAAIAHRGGLLDARPGEHTRSA